MEEIKYPYLPKDREIKYVTLDNSFMKEAQKCARELSTEQNHPTGAVVVLNGKIIGRGGNQSGFKNERLKKWHNENGMCIRKFIKAKSGTKYWACPGCASFSSHAEQMAIRDAKKNSNNGKGADMYLYGHWWACQSCWDKIMGAEIVNLFLLKNSQKLFDRSNPDNIIRTQFKK